MATTHADPSFKPVLVEKPGASALPKLDGADLRIGLVYTRHCPDVVDALVAACRAELLLKGVPRAHVHELQVALPFEIPFALKRMLQAAPTRRFFDAVVCIGCLVKGKTLGFEFVAEAVTRANMKIGMQMKTPVINGVLTCTDAHQARMCAGLSSDKTHSCNFGVEFAQSAIEMAHVNRNAMRAMVACCACDCHGHKTACACACGCEKCASSAEGCGCSDCQQRKCQQARERGESHSSGPTSAMAASTQRSLQKGECSDCGCMGGSSATK